MNEGKAVIIFILLSVVLLVGIGLLPKSPVPAASPSPIVAATTQQ
ncbi:MAG TPA: hypothetical protein VIM51_10185 [Desulfosporosinus sp.]